MQPAQQPERQVSVLILIHGGQAPCPRPPLSCDIAHESFKTMASAGRIQLSSRNRLNVAIPRPLHSPSPGACKLVAYPSCLLSPRRVSTAIWCFASSSTYHWLYSVRSQIANRILATSERARLQGSLIHGSQSSLAVRCLDVSMSLQPSHFSVAGPFHRMTCPSRALAASRRPTHKTTADDNKQRDSRSASVESCSTAGLARHHSPRPPREWWEWPASRSTARLTWNSRQPLFASRVSLFSRRTPPKDPSTTTIWVISGPPPRCARV